jgi:DNA-binding LacI/PurR family transcriptional regulator
LIILKGAYDMTNFLVEKKGVKKIFYVRPSIDNRQEREREQGVRRAAFEFPDVQVETIVIEYDFKRKYGDFTGCYIPQLRTRAEDLDDKSALICSWSGMDQPTLQVLKDINLDIPVATLAQGELSADLFSNLFYSYLPNLVIGKTCAESILRLLEDESDIRHEIVQPSLTPIINRTAPHYYL